MNNSSKMIIVYRICLEQGCFSHDLNAGIQYCLLMNPRRHFGARVCFFIKHSLVNKLLLLWMNEWWIVHNFIQSEITFYLMRVPLDRYRLINRYHKHPESRMYNTCSWIVKGLLFDTYRLETYFGVSLFLLLWLLPLFLFIISF